MITLARRLNIKRENITKNVTVSEDITLFYEM